LPPPPAWGMLGSMFFALALLLSASSLPSPAFAPSPAVAPCTVQCRYECVCFRTNGYRCFRTYNHACDGKACWQCQDRVAHRARLSCSIGAPIKSCFCKYKQLDGRARSGVQATSTGRP